MRDWTGPGWYQIEGDIHWANGQHELVTKDFFLTTRANYEELAGRIVAEGLRMMSKAEAEFYQDKAGEWRWRVRDNNGEIIDAASEGFSSRVKAEYNYDQN